VSDRSPPPNGRLARTGSAVVSLGRKALPEGIREQLLWRSPLRWVFLSRKRRLMMRRHPADHVCEKGVTRICIEGYPRSSNTFAGRMFHLANPVPVAHHTHSVNNIKLALGYEIPVLVLIRDPADAVASACIYGKQSVESELVRWLSFYEYVQRVTNRLVLANFDEVTCNFNAVIARVNQKYGTGFRLLDDLEAARREVFEGIGEYAARMGRGGDKIPMPVADREELKARQRSLVSQHPLIGSAHALYARLTS